MSRHPVVWKAVAHVVARVLEPCVLSRLRALREGGAVLGRNVLVTGATGGVGQFAVQLARAAGATVTALVSSPAREAEACELGAHRVVTNLGDPHLGPFHLVLDGVGGPVLAQAVRRMAPGAVLAAYGRVGNPASEISIGDFYRQAWNARIVGFISPVPEETKGDDLAILAGLVADGRLHPRIGLALGWGEDRRRDRRAHPPRGARQGRPGGIGGGLGYRKATALASS